MSAIAQNAVTQPDKDSADSAFWTEICGLSLARVTDTLGNDKPS